MNAPFRYPGAKWSYAKWIASFIPPHRAYLEPYFGSGAVFFTKEPAPYETINDLDNLVVNFFRVCRDSPDELARAIALTPYARTEFMAVQEDAAGQDIHLTGDSVEDARRFAVRCSMGYGSKLADRAGWSEKRCSYGRIFPNTWSQLPSTVHQVADRLKNAQIECTGAVRLIRDYNAEDCFIYADPPYLGNIRRGRIYRKEMMSEAEHKELLRALLDHRGPVILSGYENPLYDRMLAGWHKERREGRADNAEKRTETLWMNFECQTKLF